MLPACLTSPGDQSVKAHVSETDPTKLELPIDRSRPAAQSTPMLQPTAEFWSSVRLLDLCFTSHRVTFCDRTKTTSPESYLSKFNSTETTIRLSITEEQVPRNASEDQHSSFLQYEMASQTASEEPDLRRPSSPRLQMSDSYPEYELRFPDQLPETPAAR